MAKKTSLMEQFVANIEKKILSGEMLPGDKLPPLRTMAEDTGFSRSVINAGIVELSNMGYLKIVPTKWIEVADWKRGGTLAVFEGLMKYDLYKIEDLKSLLDSRKLIECECAFLSAENASITDIIELKRIVQSAKNIINTEKRTDYDINFHHLISITSGNMIYPLILKSSEKSARKLISNFYKMDNIYDFVLKKHKEIVEAIAIRDGELAKSKMLELLTHGEIKCYEDYQRRAKCN